MKGDFDMIQDNTQFRRALGSSSRVPKLVREMIRFAQEQGCSLNELQTAMGAALFALRAGMTNSAQALADAGAESEGFLDKTIYSMRSSAPYCASSLITLPDQSEISGKYGVGNVKSPDTASGSPIQPSE